MSSSIIHSAKAIHNMAIHQIQSIPEELFDIQAPQFNNTIRWHAGHIIVVLNHFLSMSIPYSYEVPEGYKGLFGPGTKPADWDVTPPTKDELVQQLSEQLEHLSEVTPDMLEETLKSPVDLGSKHFEKAGELFNFALLHEAMHLGNISSMLKVVKTM
ncbi:DinB family protein [Paenibacillus dakarensis]|uniref:DinB family protein n=1 Tax=Paenibacillus dakarensis TaxID=1527293 RepID=UPI0006D5A3A0|nr:DinB family protein [Paenibacillus dakarensis]